MRSRAITKSKFQHYKSYIDSLTAANIDPTNEQYIYLKALRDSDEVHFLQRLKKGEGFNIINVINNIYHNVLNEDQRRNVKNIPHALLLPEVDITTITSREDSSGIVQTSTGKFSDGRSAIVDHHFQTDQSPDIIVKDLLLPNHAISDELFIGNFTGTLTSAPQHGPIYARSECLIENTDALKAGLDNPTVKKLYISLLFKRNDSPIDHYVSFVIDFTNEERPVISLYNTLPYADISDELYHKECLYQAMLDIIQVAPETSPRALAILEIIDQNIHDRLAIANGTSLLRNDRIVKSWYEQPGANDCQTAAAILIKDLVLGNPMPRTAHNAHTGLVTNYIMPTNKQKEIVAARLGCLQMSGPRIGMLIEMLNTQTPQDSFEAYKTCEALPSEFGELGLINIAVLNEYLKGNTAILSTLDDSNRYALLSTLDMMLEHAPDSPNSTVYKYFHRPINVNQDLLFSELMMTYLGGIIIAGEARRSNSPAQSAPGIIRPFNNIAEIKGILASLTIYGTPNSILAFAKRFNATDNTVFLSQEFLSQLPELFESLNHLTTQKAFELYELTNETASKDNPTVNDFDKRIAFLERQYAAIIKVPFNSPIDILRSIEDLAIDNDIDQIITFIKRFNKTDNSFLTNISAQTQIEINIKISDYTDTINLLGDNPRCGRQYVIDFNKKCSLLSKNTANEHSSTASSRSTSTRTGQRPNTHSDPIRTLHTLMHKSECLDSQGRMLVELTLSDPKKPDAKGNGKISLRYIGFDADGKISILKTLVSGKVKEDTDPNHLHEITTHAAALLDFYTSLPQNKSDEFCGYIIDRKTIPGGVNVTKILENGIEARSFSAIQPHVLESLIEEKTAKDAAAQETKSFADVYLRKPKSSSPNK